MAQNSEKDDHQGMYECAICFNEYDWGYMEDKHICAFCNQKPEIYKNGMHPVTQTPKIFCKCGQPWNGTCAMRSIFSLRDREVNPQHAHPKFQQLK